MFPLANIGGRTHLVAKEGEKETAVAASVVLIVEIDFHFCGEEDMFCQILT